MKCTLSDLEQAYMFADTAEQVGGGAYLDRETGTFRYTGDEVDSLADLDDPDPNPDGEPEDLALSDRYLRVPNKRDLDLGTGLVFDFALARLPGDYDRVRDIFRPRGAYRRFKDLLERKDLLDAWYDYERSRTLESLREWAQDQGIELVEAGTAD
jgi:hypothetical protein